MKRKQILLRVIPAFIFVFLFAYISKQEDYNKWITFYKDDINAIISKIERTRGTKVYYGDKEEVYFYLEDYKGVPLKEGDSINKVNQEIEVYRKEINGGDFKYIGKGVPLKPKNSYFAYFFT
ncbi:hypothetical protein [Mariniflexile maritimum]|uniref:hypothetical protein n=1 Tax=Mariniflexile maritimum TaxID=2682493 RepID=UPI0012F7069F|nr:hypothetical protein [Mariniflexile maritimum]